jgi:ABC-type transport system involved in multi-copper enzyme maturation permease subunit
MTPGVQPVSGSLQRSRPRRRATLVALARFEARVILRGRGAMAGIVGFGIAALAVTVLGLGSFQQLGFGAVGPAAVALLNLALLLPTAQAIVVGAMATAGERGGGFLTMLRARRASPLALVGAIWMAVSLSAAIALLGGFGLAAMILAVNVPLADLLAFSGLLGVALVVAAVAASLGVLIGVVTESRLQAALAAIGGWFVLAIGLDLLLVGLGVFVRLGEPALIGAIMLNPMEAARVLALLLLDPSGSALGPAGTWAVTSLGAPVAVLFLVAALLAWLLLPLLAAARILGRQEL